MSSVKDLILRRRLQMLIHSRIYYELNTNIISDKQFDAWAKELVRLQKDYPNESKEVAWYDAFKDWDGSTGAFLPLKDEWVVRKARYILGLKNHCVKEEPKKELKVRSLF